MPKHQNQTAGLSLAEVQDLLEEKKSQLPYGYKLPYMQWYEDDFKSSEGVGEMSPLGRLMYRQLLAKAWVAKQAPYLPNDSKKLKRLADCPTDADWAECEREIREMFEVTDDGQRLFHPRQLTNYATQLLKITANIANGSQGGRPRKPTETERFSKPPLEKANGSDSLTHLELELEPELERELNLEPDPACGEEETDMRAEKELQRICQQNFGFCPKVWEREKEELKRLEQLHKGSAVVRAFEDWVREQDDTPKSPVADFLKVADDLLRGESTLQKAAAEPTVLALTASLTRLSDRKVVFSDQSRARLTTVLQTYTETEVTEAFKSFLETQDFSVPRVQQYAAKNFAEAASDLAGSVRHDREEKTKADAAREAAKLRLQEEAERERVAAETEKQKEEELFDPLAA